MARIRSLSGADLLKILSHFGFITFSQRGSHVKLRRVTPDGRRQTLTIVMHRDVDRGTLGAIYRQASRYIPEDQLRPHFFAE
jgi:predicted RNA binding protein YcfA (HicA-like mRNA interferase family)